MTAYINQSEFLEMSRWRQTPGVESTWLDPTSRHLTPLRTVEAYKVQRVRNLISQGQIQPVLQNIETEQ